MYLDNTAKTSPPLPWSLKEFPVKICVVFSYAKSKKNIKNLIEKENFLSNIISISVNGKNQNVLPREVKYHIISDEPTHVDFLRVTKNATVAVGINVEFINEDKCTGLKLGGVLNVVRAQVELNCPAISIPEKITVDLEGLNVGHTIHISSIQLPEGCTPTITDRDFTVATIAAPRGGLGDADEEEETTDETEDKEETESDS